MMTVTKSLRFESDCHFFYLKLKQNSSRKNAGTPLTRRGSRTDSETYRCLPANHNLQDGGDTTAAIKQYEKALEVNPEFQNAANVLEGIRPK